MTNDNVAISGDGSPLDESTVQNLNTALGGELVRPGGDGYDDARAIFNAMIDKRPALIARCAGAADVVHAVNFARDNALLVAVRGGGHNVAGNAVCDGGLMIDLSPMKAVRVDKTARTARAEPGVLWSEFDAETQAHELATTGGAISTTGIAGLTLGGGWGWLGGKHGLACDNLLSVDLVTAEGQHITASASENSELFWGLRGGGGNFGVVTSFEYRLHPVGPVLGGLLIHPLEKAREVLGFYDTFTRSSPDELVSLTVFATTPDGDRVIVIGVCYNGSHEAGEQILRPLRDFGAPVADTIGSMPYVEVQKMLDAGFPHGIQQYWKSSFLMQLSGDALDVMVEHMAKAPTAQCAAAFEQLGNQVHRVGEDETAYSHRDARYALLICGMAGEATEKEVITEWTRDLWQAMQPFCTNTVYVNYLGPEEDEGSERLKQAYGPRTYERLVALKNQYDPSNLFRLNQNIKPSG